MKYLKSLTFLVLHKHEGLSFATNHISKARFHFSIFLYKLCIQLSNVTL